MSARHKIKGGLSNAPGLPWRWLALGALVMFLAVAAPGCGGDGDGRTDTEGRGPTLTELRLRFIQTIGNGFILSTYTAMEEEANELVAETETFCSSPDESNLSAAQEQWRQVVGLWSESELVKFGPAADNLIHDEIDVPRGGHANASRIESFIAGDGDIDAASLPVNQRGLEGIEYLLFGDPGEVNAILDTSAGSWARRCDYLSAVAVDLHTNVKSFRDGWLASGGNYIEEWNSPGETGNTTYRSVQSAINDLMTEMEFVMDNLVNVKLQEVNWVRDVNQAGERVRKPESWRSGNSIANARQRIEATEMIYLGIDRETGADGFGMDDYLEQTGKAGLGSQIRAQFGVVLAALDAIPGTLEDATKGGQALALVDDAEEKSRVLLRLLKRELALHLDVSFGFNDADGD